MKHTKHVALLIETSREYGRGLLRGVTSYHREQANWSIYFKPQGLGAPPPPWLMGWKGDGILARIDDRRMARAVQATGLPVVDLRGALDDLGLPAIGVDNREVARLTVLHLRDCGLLIPTVSEVVSANLLPRQGHPDGVGDNIGLLESTNRSPIHSAPDQRPMC